jgi:8-oxo-dGTP pyrophosphatase MutT (NUDIX family)
VGSSRSSFRSSGAVRSPDGGRAGPPVHRRHGDIRVVLTKRPETMPTHAGHLAFPGGRPDPGDDGPVSTALREAHEEVGIEPSRWRCSGSCRSVDTVSVLVMVVPVVGRLAAEPLLVPSPREVDRILLPRVRTSPTTATGDGRIGGAARSGSTRSKARPVGSHGLDDAHDARPPHLIVAARRLRTRWNGIVIRRGGPPFDDDGRRRPETARPEGLLRRSRQGESHHRPTTSPSIRRLPRRLDDVLGGRRSSPTTTSWSITRSRAAPAPWRRFRPPSPAPAPDSR